MFSGIVTDVGRVRSVESRGDTRIVVATAYDTATIEVGASVCCSGACLTVVATGGGWFAVDVSAETLARTTLGDWQPGTPVNLERSLRVGDEVGDVAGVDPAGPKVEDAAGIGGSDYRGGPRSGAPQCRELLVTDLPGQLGLRQ